jgi:D-glycero-D-manno-heptose 1,7-bisphosphate phosphatase
MSKLVILDRDGVINEDSDQYIRSLEDWVPIDGSLEAIAQLSQAGFSIAVATNQSGVGRGYYSEQTLQQMHDKMQDLLATMNARVDYIAACLHHPDADCECRKPKAGLFKQIAKHFSCDLTGVPAVGDSLRDLQAAQVVKAQPILVRTGKGERTLAKREGLDNIPVFANLQSVVNDLLLNL